MSKSDYDVRRPTFWLVTLMAVVLVVHATIIFVRSGFSHPVSAVGVIIALSGIWFTYSSIVRDLRAGRRQIPDTLATRVEASAALCCILGYLAALPSN